MSCEVVYWLMSLRATNVAFLAYDDTHSIALLQLDDALYEIDYEAVESCYGHDTNQLSERFKQLGRLVSGLTVAAQPSPAYPPTLLPMDGQADRRCG